MLPETRLAACGAPAAALALAGCVQLQLNATSILAPDQPPAAARLGDAYAIEELEIARADRVIGVTYAHAARNRVLLIFCGGDRFHRSLEGGTVLAALARNTDVVLFDYPGLGSSSGTPDPASILDNARAVFDSFARLPATRGQRRVLYGFSLGSMVAAQLAGERAVDGVVLEGTAPDVDSWAHSRMPWYAKPFVRITMDPALAQIDNVRSLEQFRGSVLLLAGERDRQTPPRLARAVYRRLRAQGTRSALYVLPHAGHGEIYRAPAFPAILDRFLDAL